MTVYRKFEVCASYESSVVKSPPSPSRKPLPPILDMTDTTEILSPDSNQKLHFYDSIEPRMGMTMSKFSLTNNLTKEKIKFPGIWTLGYKGHSASWADKAVEVASLRKSYSTLYSNTVENTLTDVSCFNNCLQT